MPNINIQRIEHQRKKETTKLALGKTPSTSVLSVHSQLLLHWTNSHGSIDWGACSTCTLSLLFFLFFSSSFSCSLLLSCHLQNVANNSTHSYVYDRYIWWLINYSVRLRPLFETHLSSGIFHRLSESIHTHWFIVTLIYISGLCVCLWERECWSAYVLCIHMKYVEPSITT